MNGNNINYYDHNIFFFRSGIRRTFIFLFALFLLCNFPQKTNSQFTSDGCSPFVGVLNPFNANGNNASAYSVSNLVTEGSKYCFSYLRSNGDLYQVSFEYTLVSEQSTYFYYDTFYDMNYIYDGKNNDFGITEDSTFSCHCNGGTGTWERTCQKYLKKQLGATCNQTASDVKGFVYNQVCELCNEVLVEHPGNGCFLGGTVKCAKLDFIQLKGYNFFKNTQEKLPIIRVHSTVQGPNDFLVTKDFFLEDGVGINIGSPGAEGGITLRDKKVEDAGNGENYMFFVDDKSGNYTDRANMQNAYVIPVEEINAQFAEPYDIGFFNNMKIEYDVVKLREWSKNSYVFNKARPAQIERMIDRRRITDYLNPIYQAGNSYDMLVPNDKSMSINTLRTVDITVWYDIGFEAGVYVQSIWDSPPTISIVQIVCDNIDPNDEDVPCNITISSNKKGTIMISTQGIVIDTIRVVQGAKVYNTRIVSNAFLQTDVLLDFLEPSGTVLASGVAKAQVNPEDENEEESNNPIDEPDLTDDPDNEVNKKGWTALAVILGVIVGVLILLLILSKTNTRFKEMYKNMQRRNLYRKKLREKKRQEEEDEMLKELGEEEKGEIKRNTSPKETPTGKNKETISFYDL